MASNGSPDQPVTRSVGRAAQVVVVSSVMFTFISFWRTAAVVLCDMSSTVYYVGAIVEDAIGKAAPCFILAVLLFSYGMRAVYIEAARYSCAAAFIALSKKRWRFWAKRLCRRCCSTMCSPVRLAVYLRVSICRLILKWPRIWDCRWRRNARRHQKRRLCFHCLRGHSLFLAQNLIGIHESSSKALKIMMATTVMGVIMLTWSGVTLAVKGRQ